MLSELFQGVDSNYFAKACGIGVLVGTLAAATPITPDPLSSCYDAAQTLAAILKSGQEKIKVVVNPPQDELGRVYLRCVSDALQNELEPYVREKLDDILKEIIKKSHQKPAYET